MRAHAAAAPNRGGAAAGLLGTLLVHGGVVAAAVAGVLHGKDERVNPPVYAVELIAAPAPAPKQRLAPEALPTPAPEPPAPAKSTPAPPAEKAVPQPKPKRIEPQPKDREAAPKTRSQATPLPGETPSTGTDVANLKTPGLAFPYPEYLRHIVNEILRRFGTQNRPYAAEISFNILRDGSVRDIRFLKRSGNFSFDLDAQGAIEAAANAQAFGPLPDGWQNDVLPVVFAFEPR